MKYLKIILGLIVLLALIFFGSGLIRSTISYENEIVVNGSVEETWAVMADPSKMGEWLPGFVKMEHVSGIPGTEGSVSNVYFEENGEEMVIQETIVENKINERLVLTFTMDFMNMDYEVLMKEEDGQTTITTKSKTEGNGLFAKSMLSWMKGSMQVQEDENLTKLKGVVEGNDN